MNQDPHTRREAQAEQELHALLGDSPNIPEARLRRVRGAVFERLAQPPPVPSWLRWRVALPAALSLMLLGGVLGWNAETPLSGPQGLDLLAAALAPEAGGL